MVEEAGADLTLTDRWGMTPLDEAKRVGAAAVVAYLEGRDATVTAAAAAAPGQSGQGKPAEGPQAGQGQEQEGQEQAGSGLTKQFSFPKTALMEVEERGLGS